ncbi:MAG: chemotaxis protein CheD [Sulfitobacter sp.]|nr:chemotaxis protein CheD [Sulfitobacter sp.]
MTLAVPLRRYTLVQGADYVSNDPGVEISTLLGSCVSICLFDAQQAVGGMNHYLLAESPSLSHIDLKYGIHAFEVLLNGLLKLGAEKARIRAKVFGGASMKGSFAHVGPKNAQFAFDTLVAEGIECVSHDCGGTKARKVRFRPTTGQAHLMTVPPFEEDLHAARVAPPVSEDPILF